MALKGRLAKKLSWAHPVVDFFVFLCQLYAAPSSHVAASIAPTLHRRLGLVTPQPCPARFAVDRGPVGCQRVPACCGDRSHKTRHSPFLAIVISLRLCVLSVLAPSFLCWPLPAGCPTSRYLGAVCVAGTPVRYRALAGHYPAKPLFEALGGIAGRTRWAAHLCGAGSAADPPLCLFRGGLHAKGRT